MTEQASPWRRRLARFARWDFYFQVGFIVVMLIIGAILVYLERH